jgi:hypothetical protein
LILIKYQYSPKTFITRDDKGIIIPAKKFPEEFKKEIISYFSERKEDD